MCLCLYVHCVIQLRIQNVLALAAELVASDLADESFMTKSVVINGDRGREYAELNSGLWWERTEASDKMPQVTNHSLIVNHLLLWCFGRTPS